jgi:transposase
MKTRQPPQATTQQSQPRRGGRPELLQQEHRQVLRAIALEHPRLTLEAVAQELSSRTGLSVCSATVRKALRAQGIERIKPERQAVNAPARAKRYGYKDAHRREPAADRYTSSLTDAEWALVHDLFERPAGGRGMPAQIERRTMVEACCYVLRTGCAWRLLPHDFPAWTSVYKSFSRWAEQGLFEQMHDRLREQWRERLGRRTQPSAAVLDAQSTRISPQGGESGFDAGKKVKGRKRHLVVDTLGLLLAVSITAASVQDRDGAPDAVAQACAKAPGLKKLYVDGAYAGQCAQRLQAAHGIKVEVVRHPGNGNARVLHDLQQPLWPEPVPSGFVALPKRWVVERTHAWNEKWRRLIMHHDRSTRLASAWVWLAEARILANRITAQG